MVRDVGDADPQRGRELAQQLGRLHDFEGQLGADAYRNDVRVRAVLCAGEFPGGGVGPAVRFGFFGGGEGVGCLEPTIRLM